MIDLIKGKQGVVTRDPNARIQWGNQLWHEAFTTVTRRCESRPISLSCPIPL